MPLLVRDATPADAATIADFNTRLARETEAKTLDLDVLAEGVRAALAEPDRLRYWLAESEGHIVGQTAITREWSDWRNGWLWWFQSVYVHPDARGRGVFRALYQHIRNLALRQADVVGLRLYVEDNNHAAHHTYSRLGLQRGGYHVLEELWIPPVTRPRPVD